MTHLLLSLLLSTPATHVDYVKLLNADQQIINQLTAENKALKEVLFGPLGNKVYPRYSDEKPYCPVPEFSLEWIVEKDDPGQKFTPFCVRVK